MNPTVTFHVGDVLAVLRSMPGDSVDLVLSSPPFLALRSYLPADHPDKAKEIGSEQTPGEFVDVILDVVEECARVLAPHGTLVFEFGDTYAGSGGAGGDYTDTGLRAGQEKFAGSALQHRRTAVRNRGGGGAAKEGRLAQYADDRGNPDGMRDATFSGANTRTGSGDGWPLEKSLCLIPEIVRFSLAYGFNPLTGRETDQWRIRNVHPWSRPNPPVGALGDKWRPATSYLFSATKSRTRFFDLDAVRTPSDYDRPNLRAYGARNGDAPPGQRPNASQHTTNAAGAPPLDHIVLPTQPYTGSHYAVWPPKLCTPFILSMSPERVCVECGEPSRRITGEVTYERTDTDRVPARLAKNDGERIAQGVNQHHQSNGANTSVTRVAPTIGWTDCGHANWRPGVVLDPFAGSGTTLMVAAGEGRSAIGIDLDERNVELARDRLGLFAPEVIHHNAPPAAAEALYDVELPA